MRLAELRPCDLCAGPLFRPEDGPCAGRGFYVATLRLAQVTELGADLIEAAARNTVPLADLEARHPNARPLDLGPELDCVLICGRCRVAVAMRAARRRGGQDSLDADAPTVAVGGPPMGRA